MNREARIKKLLSIAGLNTEEDFKLYIDTVKMNYGEYSIISTRYIDEAFVHSYNPEWTLAWNGNTDIQLCLDFFAIIRYITEHYTKDDTGTMDMLENALKNGLGSVKEKMCLLMNTYLTRRQMGEAEAVYKMLPDLHFQESNATTFFIRN